MRSRERFSPSGPSDPHRLSRAELNGDGLLARGGGVMKFEMPGVPEAELDAAWAALKAQTERVLAREYSDRRVRSIVYAHDGAEITATVGLTRQELHQGKPRRRSDPPPRPTKKQSGNTILAIFAGEPYAIWEISSEGPSFWSNPSLASRSSIRRTEDFDAS
jgi:hypothetical protein